MWIASCIDSQRSYLLSKASAGAILGRSVECDIVLDHDKSISRRHAQLVFADDKLTLIDFGSKFGTTLVKRQSSSSSSSVGLPHKVVPNQPFELQIGDVLQFGSFTSCIQFSYQTFKFCVTRLDKTEKEAVSTKLTSLDASLVASVSECSHLVCNKFSATLKMITAMVLQKPIITSKWFEFLDSNKTAFLIPETSQYSPFDPRGIETVGKDTYIVAPLESNARVNLLSQSWVAIPDSTSLEYRDVLDGCGAEILETFYGDSMSQQRLMTQFAASKKRSSSPIRVFIFVEDEKLSSLPHETVSLIRDAAQASNLPVFYLSSRNLVQSVLTCTFPELQVELVATGTASVASRSQVTSAATSARRGKATRAMESQVMDSQALDGLMGSELEFAKPSGAAPSTKQVSTPVPVHVPVAASEPISEGRSTRARKAINSPSNSTALSNEPAPTPSHRKRKTDAALEAVPEVDAVVEVEAEAEVEMAVVDDPFAVEIIESPTRKQRRRTDVSSKETPSITDIEPARRSDAGKSLPPPETAVATVTEPSDDGWTVVNRKDPSIDQKRSPIRKNESATRHAIATQSQQFSSQHHEPEMETTISEEPEDGWYSCLSEAQKRRNFEAKKREFMRATSASTTSGGRLPMIDEEEVWGSSQPPVTDDGCFVQPVTIESTGLGAESGAGTRIRPQSRSVTDTNGLSNGLKDVRRFQKNSIRVCAFDGSASDGRIHLADMNEVYPKESEREIQMRLEAEAERRRRVMHDHLFDEEQQKGGAKAGQRKVTAR